jgi:hypothetical protein
MQLTVMLRLLRRECPSEKIPECFFIVGGADRYADSDDLVYPSGNRQFPGSGVGGAYASFVLTRSEDLGASIAEVHLEVKSQGLRENTYCKSISRRHLTHQEGKCAWFLRSGIGAESANLSTCIAQIGNAYAKPSMLQ